MKALLVGIDKYKFISGLSGCVADVDNVEATLLAAGLDGSEVQRLENEDATADKIRSTLTAMVTAAKTGDALFFHCSSHGTQLPSVDVDEPDGLDEVLCPYDFNWTAASAITDNFLQTIASMLPGGVSLTFTIDTCHSGDFSRRPLFGKRRTPLPPPEIRTVLATRKRRRSLRLVGERGNCAFASACMPWEEASEVNVGGTTQGAFSYHFFKRVAENLTEPLVDTIAATQAPLAQYKQTPCLEASEILRASPYFVTRRGLATSFVRSPREARVLWEQQWSFDLSGFQGGAGVRVVQNDATLTAELTARLLGANGTVPVVLEGDLSYTLALAFGFQVRMTVYHWAYDTEALSFDLLLEGLTPIPPPFGAPITIAQVPVRIPLSALLHRDTTAVMSPSDLVALRTLSEAWTSAPGHASATNGTALPPPRGEALVRIFLGPCDDVGYVTLDGADVMTGGNETIPGRFTVGDGAHSISFRLSNKGGWDWRGKLRVAVNDEFFVNHNVSGWSGAWAGFPPEASGTWDFFIENGRLVNYSRRPIEVERPQNGESHALQRLQP